LRRCKTGLVGLRKKTVITESKLNRLSIVKEINEKTQAPHWELTIGSLATVFILAIAFLIGIAIYLVLISIKVPEPYNWYRLNWNHIGILPIATLIPSGTMLYFLFKENTCDRTITVSSIVIILAFALAFFHIRTFKNGNVDFDAVFSLFLGLTCWLLSLLPFIWKYRKSGSVSIEKHGKHYMFLATSVMWMAPLLAESFCGLEWELNGTYTSNVRNSVWGGAGFNDFLFVLGFVTLLSLGFFAVFAPKVANWFSRGKKKKPPQT